MLTVLPILVLPMFINSYCPAHSPIFTSFDPPSSYVKSYPVILLLILIPLYDLTIKRMHGFYQKKKKKELDMEQQTGSK